LRWADNPTGYSPNATSFRQCLAGIVENLRAGHRPPTDEYEGTNTVAFGEACLKSARTGKAKRGQHIVRK